MGRVLGYPVMVAQYLNTLVGIWLMAAPTVLGYDGAPRTNDLIVGPVAATVAIIAIWDVCRSLGKLNALLGLWLLCAPWVLGYDTWETIVNDALAGSLLALLALLAGAPSGRYGGGWSSLWKKHRSPGAL